MVTAANVADHIVKHNGDADLFWDGELQSLCKTCHDSLKQSQEKGGAVAVIGVDGWPIGDRIPKPGDNGGMARPAWFRPVHVPLTIVCGPPASGKSTYVRNNAGSRDLVICSDAIAVKLFGGDKRHGGSLAPSQWRDVMRVRNEMIGDLMRPASRKRWDRAWLINTLPKASDRQWFKSKLSPSDIVVLETPIDVCLSRAKEDALRGDKRSRDAIEAIHRWWSIYTRRDGDTIVTMQ